ncbi:hypothetical protein BY458DRAFT_575317 [Sporodiniella umbellata]|nr:hypothetical protein BY458DRAFT_575317 [Sporodiniella umbellata]
MAPSYTYPVAGIAYFLSHPQLWAKSLCPFLLTLVFGLISLVISFVYLLPLQAHALIQAHCPAWLAWTVSVLFVLLESALLDLLAFAIVLPIFQDALFDATLRCRGLDRMFLSRVPVSEIGLNRFKSWGHHIHYDLEFRGLNVSQSRRLAWKSRSAYCQFGAVAVALELVPLFNLLFMWTNVVGAALYVGDKYEKNERIIARHTRKPSGYGSLA